MTRKKGITIRYSNDEYKEIEKKAKMYNYRSNTEYIRDISLNETIVIESIENKEEICNSFGMLRRVLLKEEKELKEIIPKLSSTKEDRIKFENMINSVIERRKIIEKLINDKLFREFRTEIKKYRNKHR